MADTKASAFTAVSTVGGTDVVPVVQGGVNKKATVTQLAGYYAPPAAASTAAQSGFAADTYLAGSGVTVVPARLQAGTLYRCVFQVVKTAAGVAAPVVTIRMGTAGTTADASLVALTFAAQTAVVDEGEFEIKANIRTSGASGVVQGYGKLSHRLVTTGLNVTAVNTFVIGTSAATDISAVTKIGLSVNGGTSAAWTINLVQADVLNLA